MIKMLTIDTTMADNGILKKTVTTHKNPIQWYSQWRYLTLSTLFHESNFTGYQVNLKRMEAVAVGDRLTSLQTMIFRIH